MKAPLCSTLAPLAFIASLGAAGAAAAAGNGWPGSLFTETYDEVGTTPEYPFPFPPCQGLVVNGVRYGFLVDGQFSGDCRVFVLSFDPDPLSGQVIDADAAGELRLTFDQPTRSIAFDFLVNTPEDKQVNVTLVARNGREFTRSFIASSSGPDRPATAAFQYHGAPVAEIFVTVDDAAGLRFAIDNVTFER